MRMRHLYQRLGPIINAAFCAGTKAFNGFYGRGIVNLHGPSHDGMASGGGPHG
jgi:hypothetical protein